MAVLILVQVVVVGLVAAVEWVGPNVIAVAVAQVPTHHPTAPVVVAVDAAVAVVE